MTVLFPVILCAFVMDMTVVTRAENRPENLFFACSFDDDDTKAIVILEKERTPVAWKRIIKDLPNGDCYIVKNSKNQVGLIYDGSLLYFGDIDRIGEKDFTHLLNYFLSVAEKNSGRIITNLEKNTSKIVIPSQNK